jgi:hypothetical protein
LLIKTTFGVGMSSFVVHGLFCAWQMDIVPTKPVPNRMMIIETKAEYIVENSIFFFMVFIFHVYPLKANI